MRSRHVRSFVAGEEHGRRSDVRTPTDAAQRNRRDNFFASFWHIEKARRQARIDPAGRDRINANAEVGEFLRHGPHEHQRSRFDGAVVPSRARRTSADTDVMTITPPASLRATMRRAADCAV